MVLYYVYKNVFGGKMKKLLISMFVFALVLAGCSSSTSADNKISVGIWESNDGENEAFQKIISEFEAETGAEIELRTYADYAQQLTTELYGGTGPDVFMVDGSEAQNYINQGALLALDGAVSDSEKADFYDGQLDPYIGEDGTLYAIPKDWSPLAVYCNNDLISNTSYSCDDIPTQLEDWPDFLGALQQELPDGTYASSLNPNLHLFGPWLQVNDNSIIAEDGSVDLMNENILSNAQIVTDLFASDGFFEVTDVGYASDTDAFISGDSAIMISGAWNVGVLDDTGINYTVLEMPTYKGDHATSMYSTGWGVNSSSQNPELATQFVEFAADRGSEIFCEDVGSLPARKSVAETVGTMDTKQGPAMMAMSSYATPVQFGTVTTPLINEWANVIPEVKSGNMTLEDAFQQIQDRVNADLENFNE